MYCTQCGMKLEDGYKFCPECGTSITGTPERHHKYQARKGYKIPRRYRYYVDTEPKSKFGYSADEVEDIADKLFWECPCPFGKKQEKNLVKKCGIPMKEAEAILRYKSKCYRRDEKLGMYPVTDFCPACGSQEWEPYVWNPMGSIEIELVKCIHCGRKWHPDEDEKKE